MMSQLHEIKLISPVSDVLELLTVIMTLNPYLLYPSSPKCGPCVSRFKFGMKGLEVDGFGH